MASTVIPPSTPTGPTGRQLLLTELEYGRAADIQLAIQREIEWLRRAWSCYDVECFRRLMQYSEQRLQYRIEHEFATPCQGVRLQALLVPDGPPMITVSIGWASATGRRLLRAWTDMIAPRVQA